MLQSESILTKHAFSLEFRRERKCNTNAIGPFAPSGSLSWENLSEGGWVRLLTFFMSVSSSRSIGCTVVEMLTGKPPWSELEPMTAVYNIGTGRRPPELPTNLSGSLKDFLHQSFKRFARLFMKGRCFEKKESGQQGPSRGRVGPGVR